MNKQRLFVYLFEIIFIAILLACSRADSMDAEGKHLIMMEVKSDVMVDKDRFVELIKNVQHEAKLTIVWDFKNSKSFLEIENCSNELIYIALDLLEMDELSLVEKQIVVYAIQNVELDIFKYFLLDLAISFNNEKIDEYLIDHCFFPRDGWSYQVIENYNNPMIKRALKTCIKSNKINSNLRENMQLVLKGKTWKEIKKQRLDGTGVTATKSEEKRQPQ